MPFPHLCLGRSPETRRVICSLSKSDRRIVLLGRPSTIRRPAARALRPNIAMMLLRNLSAMAGLRRYLEGHRLAEDLSRLSDHDVLQQVDWAIRSRQLETIVVIGAATAATMRDHRSAPARPRRKHRPAESCCGQTIRRSPAGRTRSGSREESFAGRSHGGLRKALQGFACCSAPMAWTAWSAQSPSKKSRTRRGVPGQLRRRHEAGIALTFGGIAGAPRPPRRRRLPRAPPRPAPPATSRAPAPGALAARCHGHSTCRACWPFCSKARVRKVGDGRPPAEEVPPSASSPPLRAAPCARGKADSGSTATPTATSAGQTRLFEPARRDAVRLSRGAGGDLRHRRARRGASLRDLQPMSRALPTRRRTGLR